MSSAFRTTRAFLWSPKEIAGEERFFCFASWREELTNGGSWYAVWWIEEDKVWLKVISGWIRKAFLR